MRAQRASGEGNTVQYPALPIYWQQYCKLSYRADTKLQARL